MASTSSTTPASSPLSDSISRKKPWKAAFGVPLSSTSCSLASAGACRNSAMRNDVSAGVSTGLRLPRVGSVK
eukprot:scaffold509_cov110-Pinguiococcus_pyrenoidosus.AAC.1